MNMNETIPETAEPPPQRHPDIFADTIAEMTWFDVDAAAKEGAILLWAFGVIEQHGPHLPTGTDVYIPSARLRRVKAMLAERGIRALIVPAYYWGINQASGGFPASYRVSPGTMKALMGEVFASFKTDGFRHVFCFTGHGDAMHNRTIHEGIVQGVAETGLDISYVTETAMATRLGIDLKDPHITLHAPQPEAESRFFQLNLKTTVPAQPDAPPKYVDVHAGQRESSMMLCAYPSLVRDDIRRTLKSTDYGPADLAEWRRGFEEARRKTPDGYFGDPAAASAEQGQIALARLAMRDAAAIEQRLARLGTPTAAAAAQA